MDKKGIFFMMLTIIILSLFVISLTFFSGVALRKSVQERVESLSEFVNAVETDLPRQLFIVGYRAIFLMEKEIVNTGNYLDKDVNSLLQEAFFNGTINGETPDVPLHTFNNLQTSLQARADKISAEVALSNPRINITQEDPWNVKITFVADFLVEDKNKLALWNKTLVSFTYISISNFTDPLYVVATQGGENPYFVKTIYTSPGGVGQINEHLANGYYRNFSGAPSFIDRLEGDLSGSVYGIESLVNEEKVGSASTNSNVDYLYFYGSNPGSIIAGTPSWFVLDDTHRAVYGV